MARAGKQDRGIYEYPRGSGKVFIEYTDGEGRRRRETIGTCTEPRCELHGTPGPDPTLKCRLHARAASTYRSRKAEARRMRANPPSPASARQTPLLTDVLRSCLKASRVRGSWKDDVRYARFWGQRFADLPLGEIRPSHVREAQQHLLTTPSLRGRNVMKNRTPATANRYVAFLKKAFFFAMEDGLVDRNPCSFKGALLPENNLRCRFLTPEQEIALRNAMPEARWHYVLLAIETGMRQSEQMGLRWENVDFANRVLTVPRSKHGEKRHVPLSDTALELLRDMPSRLKGPLVYPSPVKRDRPMTFSPIRPAFERAVERSGLADFHWHDLRHTFASRAVMAGVDLMTVAEWMGHRSLAMMRRYAHLAPDHHREAMEKVKSKFRSTAKEPPIEESPNLRIL